MLLDYEYRQVSEGLNRLAHSMKAEYKENRNYAMYMLLQKGFCWG